MRLGGIGRCAARSAARAGLETGVPSRVRGLAVGAFVFLLAAPLGGETPEEFSGIPWESLEELPDGLAAVRAAATHRVADGSAEGAGGDCR